jgi:hypothetical protein
MLNFQPTHFQVSSSGLCRRSRLVLRCVQFNKPSGAAASLSAMRVINCLNCPRSGGTENSATENAWLPICDTLQKFRAHCATLCSAEDYGDNLSRRRAPRTE